MVADLLEHAVSNSASRLDLTMACDGLELRRVEWPIPQSEKVLGSKSSRYTACSSPHSTKQAELEQAKKKKVSNKFVRLNPQMALTHEFKVEVSCCDSALVDHNMLRLQIPCRYHPIKGKMAERSKALASGASQVIGVGSNPTLVKFLPRSHEGVSGDNSFLSRLERHDAKGTFPND
ncbi:hypothetical protein BDP55DRAFT_632198 [Colletotrichum godetiae]|uniref:Uncharacterized protein n=1 Tax=Colletotrichum godetiae TaxID=1209918 RepID=A0AAJ0EXT2_9PEZI|nr:uncharacterized protein BDP55DRAFT_632198 [Colletotrichum godetiae]KAK1675520.1 hypothetical protein BDP55DRAFT_632198 [Colletotrichum godetiae]